MILMKRVGLVNFALREGGFETLIKTKDWTPLSFE